MDHMLREMVRQASAERAVIELFVAIDHRDWARVRRLLASEVDVDLVAMGGAHGCLDADALVSRWTAGMDPLDAVHHQIGNMRSAVHDDDAHVACYGTTWHHRRHPSGRNTCLFVGLYDVGLRDSPRGWHVHTLRFRMRFTDGNPDLV